MMYRNRREYEREAKNLEHMLQESAHRAKKEAKAPERRDDSAPASD